MGLSISSLVYVSCEKHSTDLAERALPWRGEPRLGPPSATRLRCDLGRETPKPYRLSQDNTELGDFLRSFEF